MSNHDPQRRLAGYTVYTEGFFQVIATGLSLEDAAHELLGSDGCRYVVEKLPSDPDSLEEGWTLRRQPRQIMELIVYTTWHESIEDLWCWVVDREDWNGLSADRDEAVAERILCGHDIGLNFWEEQGLVNVSYPDDQMGNADPSRQPGEWTIEPRGFLNSNDWDSGLLELREIPEMEGDKTLGDLLLNHDEIAEALRCMVASMAELKQGPDGVWK